MLGSIPFISDGPVDELLQEGGNQLEKTAKEMKMDAVHQLVSLSNSGTHVFAEKMEDMIQIYNHTEEICFNNEEILLVVNQEMFKRQFEYLHTTSMLIISLIRLFLITPKITNLRLKVFLQIMGIQIRGHLKWFLTREI